MKLSQRQLVTCILASVLVVGCAAKPSPDLVAARAVNVLERVQVAQSGIIIAEANGLIDQATAAAALTRISQSVRHSQALRPLLEGWEALSDAEKADRLTRARTIVFTLSQVLAAITLPAEMTQPVQNALVASNGLLLRLADLRGAR